MTRVVKKSQCAAKKCAPPPAIVTMRWTPGRPGRHNAPMLYPALRPPLPRDAVLSRLGWHRHRTELAPGQEALLEEGLAAGFAACRPQGASARIAVAGRSETAIRLATGEEIVSASFAALCARSVEIVFLAATVGPQPLERIREAIERGDGATAAILDAVASETADAALDRLQEAVAAGLLREGLRLTRRFSPGYGDLALSWQAAACRILGLERLGVAVTDRFQLVPEKSVIALAGAEAMP